MLKQAQAMMTIGTWFSYAVYAVTLGMGNTGRGAVKVWKARNTVKVRYRIYGLITEKKLSISRWVRYLYGTSIYEKTNPTRFNHFYS